MSTHRTIHQEVASLRRRLSQVEQERDAMRLSVEANRRDLKSREVQLHAILDNAVDGIVTIDE